MKLYSKSILKKTLFFLLLITFFNTSSQTTVGSGSYTTNYPGADSAGRNGFPSGEPQTTGIAATKPVPIGESE